MVCEINILFISYQEQSPSPIYHRSSQNNPLDVCSSQSHALFFLSASQCSSHAIICVFLQRTSLKEQLLWAALVDRMTSHETLQHLARPYDTSRDLTTLHKTLRHLARPYNTSRDLTTLSDEVVEVRCLRMRDAGAMTEC